MNKTSKRQENCTKNVNLFDISIGFIHSMKLPNFSLSSYNQSLFLSLCISYNTYSLAISLQVFETGSRTPFTVTMSAGALYVGYKNELDQIR